VECSSLFDDPARQSDLRGLKYGRIVESRTHDQLLPAGGLYAKLYELQFSSEELAGRQLSRPATA
jgi:hypothetical protein